MKIKRKRATAGERIAGSVWFCKAMRSGITPEDQETLMRRIDSAIRRAVKAERVRCTWLAALCENGMESPHATRIDIQHGRER